MAGLIQNTRRQLARAVGSTLIGFVAAGAGAVPSTVADPLQETVRVSDYMSAAQRMDVYLRAAQLDIADPIRKAIEAGRGKNGSTIGINQGAVSIAVVLPPGWAKVSSTVLVPLNTTIRGNGTTIIANEQGPTFETGYYDNGVLISNWGLSDADVTNHALSGTRFECITFVGGDNVLNLRCAVWQSGVFCCSFYKAHIAITARQCFYATYDNIAIRDDNPNYIAAGLPGAHAMRLQGSTNRVLINNVSITTRDRGIILGEAGAANICGQVTFSNSSIEAVSYGFEFTGTVRNFHAHDIYFESVSSVFYDGDGALKYNLNIHDCYSNSTAFFCDLSGLRDSYVGQVRDWKTGMENVKAAIRLRQGTYGNQCRVARSHSGELTAGDMATRYQLSDGVMTDGWLVAREVDANGAATGPEHVVLNQLYEHNISQSQYAQQIPIYDRGYFGVSKNKVVGVVSGNMTAVNGTEPYFLTNFFYNEYTMLSYSIQIIPDAGSGSGGTNPLPIWLKGNVFGKHGTQIVPNGHGIVIYRNDATGTFQLSFSAFGTDQTDPAYAWMRQGKFKCEGIVKLNA